MTAGPAQPGTRGMPPHFSFVLLPGFSMMALTSVIDPLRHANQVIGREHYSWQVHSEQGQPVPSSSRLVLPVSGGLEEVDLRSTIVLCGGVDIALQGSGRLFGWVRKAAALSPMLGALCTAPRILAQAGVLDGHRATIHWEQLAAFSEAFPRVLCRQSLYELDRNRMTCAGETVGIDMMVAILTERHGRPLAARVAAQLLHGRVRDAGEPQTPPQIRYSTRDPKLVRMIQIMEQNLEDPLDLGRIIAAAGISRRQAERLFNKHMHATPLVFYRNLRLDRARQLLLETEMSCLEVAIACGFSLSGLRGAYRQRFGVTPNKECGYPHLRQVA